MSKVANPHDSEKEMAGLESSINVDISMEYLNVMHLQENGGRRTSKFIKECLHVYKPMRDLIRLLKYLLSNWNLNKTYTGTHR